MLPLAATGQKGGGLITSNGCENWDMSAVDIGDMHLMAFKGNVPYIYFTINTLNEITSDTDTGHGAYCTVS